MLIKYNPGIESEDEIEQTPLHTAANYGSSQVVILLLEHKADTIARGLDKEIASYTTVSCSNIEVAELLLNYQAQIEAKNKNNHAALHIAVK